jgi:hypothetical protein
MVAYLLADPHRRAERFHGRQNDRCFTAKQEQGKKNESVRN